MASSNNSSQNLIKSTSAVICSKCKENLVFGVERGDKILRTFCGHVIHETCLMNHNEEFNFGRSPEQRLNYCPCCNVATEIDFSANLFLQLGLDQDYLRLAEENKELRVKNDELRKQLNVSAINLTLIGPNKEKSYEKIGSLSWNDFTEEFQKDLRKKIEQKFGLLNIHNIDLHFLRSKTLFLLLNDDSDKDVILSNIATDYYDHQFFSNVHPTFPLFEKLFRKDFFTTLRIAVDVPSLNSTDIPITEKVLKFMMHLENRGHDNVQNKAMLIQILNAYLPTYSKACMIALCRIALFQLISDELNDDIELEMPFIDDNVQFYLSRYGYLKKVKGKFQFVHNLVKVYVVTMVIISVKRSLKTDIMNAQQCFFGEFEQYYILYLNSLPIHDKNLALRLLRVFDVKDTENIRLLLALAVMKLTSSSDLIKVMQHFGQYFTVTQKGMWEIEYPCVIRGHSIKSLSIPCLAAIRGDIVIFNELYSFFNLSGEAKRFELAVLVHLCSSWTLGSSQEQLRDRKELISFIINDSGLPNKKQNAMDTPKSVHREIIDHIIEIGIKYFRNIWNVDLMVQELASLVEQDEFCKVVSYVYKQDDLINIVETYCSTVSAQVKL